MIGSTQIIIGDVLDRLRELPDEHFHCVVTSPPYWGLRDYGTGTWEGGDPTCEHCGTVPRTVSGGDGKQYSNVGSNRVFSGNCKCGAVRVDGQIGLEPTPEAFVARIVAVFREVRRVLRKDGVLFLNMGDSYAGSNQTVGTNSISGVGKSQPHCDKPQWTNGKPKDLMGMPWRVAFALQADGWWLRSDIIWHKPNPMPESCADRPTKSHEYVFLLTRSARYFYDAEAVKQPHTSEPHSPGYVNGETYAVGPMDRGGHSQREDPARVWGASGGANLRTVWTIPTQSYREAHFATYPEKLAERCIKAGTSAKGCCTTCGTPWVRIVKKDRHATRPGLNTKADFALYKSMANELSYVNRDPGRRVSDVVTLGWEPGCTCGGEPVRCRVLDPFCGSGTSLLVAARLGCDAVGIELKPAYAAMAERRIGKGLRPATYRDNSEIGDAPLFAD